jgi:hypothetical protein
VPRSPGSASAHAVQFATTGPSGTHQMVPWVPLFSVEVVPGLVAG